MASNRDILMLGKYAILNNEGYQQILHQIENAFDAVERLDNFCRCYEVFDINKYVVYRKNFQVQQMLKDAAHIPFVFFCCKN